MAGFTEKEKKVFYGLVRWPHLTDAELAGKLGLGRSTVSAIKKRLEGGRMYETRNIPDLEKIGCEMLTAMYGKHHAAGMARRFSELDSELGSIFFMMSMGAQKISLGAAKTYTKIREHITDYHRLHAEGGLRADKKHQHALFPLKLARMHRFFDYAPLLKEHFKLDLKEEKEKKVGERMKLTENEKQVLYAIVKHPDEADWKIAQSIGMSRQTASNIKNKLLENGLVRKIRIPDVGKLGYELVAFTHLHLNPQKPLEERQKILEGIHDCSHIFKIASEDEGLMLSVYRDYTEYLEKHDSVLARYKREGMLLEDPEVRLFSTRAAGVEMHHRYHPLVEEVCSLTE